MPYDFYYFNVSPHMTPRWYKIICRVPHTHLELYLPLGEAESPTVAHIYFLKKVRNFLTSTWSWIFQGLWTEKIRKPSRWAMYRVLNLKFRGRCCFSLLYCNKFVLFLKNSNKFPDVIKKFLNNYVHKICGHFLGWPPSPTIGCPRDLWTVP